MFRGIKNIASEIRNEVSGLENNIHSHSRSHSGAQSQSESQTQPQSTTSRTKRFLVGNRNSNGALGLRKKKKEFVEVDGSKEEDIIVNKALIKFFKEQNKALPPYLNTGNENGSSGKISRKFVSQPREQLQQEQNYQIQTGYIQRPTQQTIQQQMPDRPMMRKAASEAVYNSNSFDDEVDRDFGQYHAHSQSQSNVSQKAINQSAFERPKTTSRFQSRFSNTTNSGVNNSTQGGSSRFGRRVE